ncbi:Signal transduction histidine kinase [Yoonia tamlensis]|uniref:histidine kinase n=1 Tax=Yoonia tamlensis TaxID=390270 RepID=A0A1I6FSM6_9RHOB|nr:sensor histidine kinase [Yoonia tamlensis]SFR32962.1 Signal transduction histidine kinase [Yoonia tamlensis]
MKSSLSLRLIWAATVTTVLGLIATAFVLNFLFRMYFEERVNAELEAYLLVLSANVGVDAQGEVVVAPLADPRFEQALSGYFWQIQIDDDPPILSPSFWAAPLALDPPLTAGHITYENVTMGTGETVAVASWVITTGADDTRQKVFLAVAIDRTGLDASVAGFFTNSAIALTLLGALLLMASWVQVRLGLKPLDKVRADLARIRNSATDRLSQDYPDEILPLADEVNQLLDTNDATLARVRAGAANLAHGIKTPLTIIHGIERKLRHAAQDVIADELHNEAASIAYIVERELARSRDSHQSKQRSAILPIAKRLQDALGRQPGVDHISWKIDVAAQMRAPFDEFDLTELLGNLFDNAVKWADTQITIRAAQSDGAAFLTVDDDGPGIPEAARATVLERGGRLDADKPGTGLGLSIVQDMAQSHGCTLVLGRAPMGGLRVTLNWPVA